MLYVESGFWIGKSGEGNIASIAVEHKPFGRAIYSQADVRVSDSHVEGNQGAGVQTDPPTGAVNMQILRSHILNNKQAGLHAENTH
jgi:hypothetical protein